MAEARDFEPGRYDLGAEPQFEFELGDREETVRLGRAFAGGVEPGDVVGLIGALGSGKTTFVTGMADEFGAPHPATSPTYTLLNRYPTDPPLVHVDLYRLDSVDGLETTGYWDFVRKGDAVFCVEWIDRIPGAWPGAGIIVRLEHRSEGRAAEIWATSELVDRTETIVETFGSAR